MLLARARPALRPSAAAFGRVAVAAVPAAVVALLPGIPSLVAGAVGVACFCALAWRLGAVPPELVDAIRRRSEASA